MVITFPLGIILVPYAIVLLFFVFIAFFNVYNLVRFDATNMLSFVATFCFLAGATVVLVVTWNHVKDVDWSQPISLGTPADKTFPSIDGL